MIRCSIDLQCNHAYYYYSELANKKCTCKKEYFPKNMISSEHFFLERRNSKQIMIMTTKLYDSKNKEEFYGNDGFICNINFTKSMFFNS
jgi:hypothetical protein